MVATAVFADATTNKCWFGTSSISTGNILVSVSSWTVHIKRGKFISISNCPYGVQKHLQFFFSAFAQTTDGVFTTTIVPNSELTDSSWNRYVYRVYSGSNVDFDRCTTMCAFDYPNVDGSNCHFISFESNICYLGSLAGENNLLANTMPTTLHLKTGNKTSFHIVSRSQFCAFQMCWVQV